MIADFISEMILLPRVKQSSCLAVYDPEKRYKQLCMDLASDKIVVIDASDSSIESREEALKILLELGQHNTKLEGMLIYIPKVKPQDDEQKQSDPFAAYIQCGSVFPKDDGDEYFSLCLRAKPEEAMEIRRVFQTSPNGPSFAVIDAIGKGNSWPLLRTTLKVDSAREILLALLAPNEKQVQALKKDGIWFTEAQDFLFSTLLMEVKTRINTWDSLADELWRYVLFGEFAFDMKEPLPNTFKNVPRPPEEARHIIEDVCNRLRSDPKVGTFYMKQAACVENELNLSKHFYTAIQLGNRDTFPFEERLFLHEAVKALSNGNTDLTRMMISSCKNSIWLIKGESQAEWDLVSSGLKLMESCDDIERQLANYAHSLTDIVSFYTSNIRESDRLHREFEQALIDLMEPTCVLDGLVELVRGRYNRLTEKVQVLFTKHVKVMGWPPTGLLSNSEVFDRFICEALKDKGQRIAYLLVDSLRYEMGVELQKLLSEDHSVTLFNACAQLPSITRVGMASLLPSAHTELTLTVKNEEIIPMLAGRPVITVDQRMDSFRRRYGDRFAETDLGNFINKKFKIPDTVDLLVVRSREIDSLLENNPETTLGLIINTLKQVRVALAKLKNDGFNEAVIATDHGFFLNIQAEAGDICNKPPGNWPVNVHDRMLLGIGRDDGNNVVMPTEKLNIKCELPQAAFPYSMAPYRAGVLYFHGGISLAEIITPVLVVRMQIKEDTLSSGVDVELNYKNGAKQITTHRPVIELILRACNLFASENGTEILLEAQDSKGNIVGEPLTGGVVNPATGTIMLMPGQKQQVVLKMDVNFEGKFTVKALNPTSLVTYCSLDLETEYTI